MRKKKIYLSRASSWEISAGHPALSSIDYIVIDYIVIAYVVVVRPTVAMSKRKFSPPSTSSSSRNLLKSTMRAFLKPIHYLINFLMSIPHRIMARNVPRLRNCKERMDLAMELAELEEVLDEEEGFSAGLVM